MAGTRYWLFKREADHFDMDALMRKGKPVPWKNVRNYTVRNWIRQEMRPGQKVLLYQSGAEEPAVLGVGEIAKEPYPDPAQFDPKSPYFDPRATKEKPIWYMVDVMPLKAFRNPVKLAEMRANPNLDGMMVLRKGNRFSMTPVEPKHWNEVLAMAGEKSPKA